MRLNLTPELENLVMSKVASGRYVSAGEVLREALRLLDERDTLSARRDEVRDRIRLSLEALDRGDGSDGEEFFDALTSDLRHPSAG